MLQKMSPQFVSAAEVSRNFGLWQDRASHGPLIVTHHGRPRITMLAIDAYDALAGVAEPTGGELEAMQLAVLLEHVNGGFFAFDRDLRFTRLNSEALVHFGKPAEALLGHSIVELFPDVEHGPGIMALRRVAEGGDDIFMDAPSHIHPGRLMRMRVFPYPGGAAAVFRNVSHEVQVAHAVNEREALTAARDAHGRVALARMSLRGTFEQAERGLAQIAGFLPERLRGVRLTDLLVLKDRGAANSDIEAVLGRGETRCFRSKLMVNGGGEIPVCVALAPIREGFGIPGAMVLITVEEDKADA